MKGGKEGKVEKPCFQREKQVGLRPKTAGVKSQKRIIYKVRRNFLLEPPKIDPYVLTEGVGPRS